MLFHKQNSESPLFFFDLNHTILPFNFILLILFEQTSHPLCIEHIVSDSLDRFSLVLVYYKPKELLLQFVTYQHSQQLQLFFLDCFLIRFYLHHFTLTHCYRLAVL